MSATEVAAAPRAVPHLLLLLGAVGTAAAAALVAEARRARRAEHRERVARAELERELQEQRSASERHARLRDEERRGRIRAELELREACRDGALPRPAAAAGEVTSPEEVEGAGGFVFHPIGTFASCYRNRCGTPRQGGIVPESLAVLRCSRDLNPEAALEGFDAYSHCWVLYVFHQNTNLQREGRTTAKRRQTKGRIPLWQGLCMKVAPPRCPDRDLRVGVLACRTPHRPNPVGLSLARIVRVDAAAGEVVLAGLDVVDGTPCLDLKPYLPSFECVPDAIVPGWVQASFEEPLMQVEWSPEASATLSALAHVAGGKEHLSLEPFTSELDLRRALEGTLALDIRSPVQRQRHPHPGPGVPDKPFFTGDLWFHELHVTYSLRPCELDGGARAAPVAVRIERVEHRAAAAAATATAAEGRS